MKSDKTWGNSFNLYQERFKLGNSKNSTNREAKHWNGLPGEVVESLFLEVCRICGCDSKGDGLVMGLSRSGCWLDMIIL